MIRAHLSSIPCLEKALRVAPLILLLFFGLCSCVRKETYEKQVGATASATRALKGLRAKNAELLKRLSRREAELKQRTGESKRYAAQLHAANADLQRYEKDQRRLESALNDTRQDATQAAERRQKRIARLQSELTALKKQADSDRIACQARLASTKHTCDQLTGYLEQARGEATARAAGLKQQRDACHQQLVKGDTVREKLTDRLAGLQAQLAVLQGKLQRVEAAAAKRQAALQEAAARLRRGLRQEMARGELSVSEGKGRVSVRIGLDRLFAGDETDLTPAGEALLGRIGQLLQGAKGLEVDIEGHGARVPVSEEVKKGGPNRWELATTRAVKVMYSLRLQSEIPNGRLGMVDFGPAPVLPRPGREAGREGKGQIDIVLLPARSSPDALRP